ncbi:TetR/AcrR family transcriptional regulator [Alicyclobacillus dauci]|uniref:TetR/AcrR family transcriptional regulator n=1 Tax=Alicyclobacillus dauci TaxID=1475485 RepID=A0ABY6Z415_9BACL|nr:TetR/AcrR family transcriptional regulator [Alicyclobacillus dauci]WAH37263.1 TetR/AcrR family transcriptional regulator [Alicyclobacillus dauci]
MDLSDRVVEAAATSFRQFGYKGTTMDQVARIANVGKGTIYTFFPSKEALFEHILNSLIDEMRRLAEEAIQPGDPFFVNLERAMRKVLQFRQQHELFVKLAHEVRYLGTAAVGEGLDRVERAIVSYLRRHIEDGIKHGDVKECNAELVAFILLKTYTAMVNEWALHHTPLTDDELMRIFHLVFAQGLDQSKQGGGSE